MSNLSGNQNTGDSDQNYIINKQLIWLKTQNRKLCDLLINQQNSDQELQQLKQANVKLTQQFESMKQFFMRPENKHIYEQYFNQMYQDGLNCQ